MPTASCCKNLLVSIGQTIDFIRSASPATIIGSSTRSTTTTSPLYPNSLNTRRNRSNIRSRMSSESLMGKKLLERIEAGNARTASNTLASLRPVTRTCRYNRDDCRASRNRSVHARRTRNTIQISISDTNAVVHTTVRGSAEAERPNVSCSCLQTVRKNVAELMALTESGIAAPPEPNGLGAVNASHRAMAIGGAHPRYATVASTRSIQGLRTCSAQRNCRTLAEPSSARSYAAHSAIKSRLIAGSVRRRDLFGSVPKSRTSGSARPRKWGASGRAMPVCCSSLGGASTPSTSFGTTKCMIASIWSASRIWRNDSAGVVSPFRVTRRSRLCIRSKNGCSSSYATINIRASGLRALCTAAAWAICSRIAVFPEPFSPNTTLEAGR